MNKQNRSASTPLLQTLLGAAAALASLSASGAAAAAAEDPTLIYDGTPTAPSWSIPAAEVGVKLCLKLSVVPTAGTSIDLIKVKGNQSPAVVGSTAEGKPDPWKKADWKVAGSRCWEPREGKATYTLALIDAGGKLTALSANTVQVNDKPIGQVIVLPSDPPPAPPVRGPDDVGKHDTAEVVEKAQAYAAEKVKPFVDDRGALLGRREITLSFLPDGRPVRPLPADLSERDTIHLAVLMPQDELDATLNVIACPDRQPFRISGSFEAVKSQISGAQTNALPPVKAIGTVNLSDLRCGAGQIAFEIKTPYGSTSHSLKLGEVYTGTFGVQLTFSFSRNGALSLQPDAQGKAIIPRDPDYLGPKLVPVFVLHPFGFDPVHASVGGALVNPTLGFDLDGITSGFSLGDSVCLYFGCLTAGLQIRRVDALQGPSGLKVGDAYDTTKGALPTTSRFTGSDGGLGPYIGLILDVNAAARLLTSK